MPERPTPRPRRPVPHALDEVASRVGARITPPAAGASGIVTGITVDSRDVRPGDLFAALPGGVTHGARFAADAAARGAVAVLTDVAGTATAANAGLPVLEVDDPRGRLGALAAWVYGNPADDLLLVGVTGTNGKTTTVHLVDAVLRRAGHRTGLVGTVATRIGDAAVPSVRTTPEAPALQALLAVMREDGVTAVALEVSSHALVLGRVDGVVVDVAAFTNLSRDHLDFHGDMERYFAAKAALFTPDRARAGVVCVDDAWGRRLATSATVPIQTVTTRGDVPADWRVVDRVVRRGAGGTTFALRRADGATLGAASPFPGDFNIANAAVAALCATLAGVAPEDVTAGLAGAPTVPGRMERVSAGAEPLALVDYAHTPEAIATALAAVRGEAPGRLAVVIGAGGGRDPGKREAMGAAAASCADLVVVTDDNPRAEDPAAIRAAVLAGAREAARATAAEVVEVADRAVAIAAAVEGLGPGDAVVVAGKGHEPGQEVGGRMLPFDDRVVLRNTLRDRVAVREPR